MRIYYDREGDFLEISVGSPVKCYAEEIEPGIFVRKDEKTNEIKSIGIIGFKERSSECDNFELMLPLKFSISIS